MTSLIAPRVERIKPSPTLAVSARAEALKAEGKNIINLGVGEPDFDTPAHIKEAAIKAIRDGFTKYTAVDGTASLKRAIVDKFSRENQLNFSPAQILVSCGAKQSCYNVTQAIISEGDEVLIPAPYWVSYPDMVLLAGGTPKILPTTAEQHFKITADQLAQSISPQTKLLIINSPSNPSGVAYSRTELQALAEVLVAHPQVHILTDDMYEHILWQHQPYANLLNVCPELTDRTIVVNGVSKAYAMTGWRIGYAAGPTTIINAMKKIQSQSTSNPTSISQVAAEVALNSDQSIVRTMCAEFKRRHDYVISRLGKMSGVKTIPADGTFYIFPNIEGALAKHSIAKTDHQFSEYLLEQFGVALVPGTAFGAPGCIRLSFATSDQELQQALDRLEKALEG